MLQFRRRWLRLTRPDVGVAVLWAAFLDKQAGLSQSSWIRL